MDTESRPGCSPPDTLRGERLPIRSRVLRSVPEASSEARRFVREAAADVHPKLLNDVLLLTNELVTNAVRHAGHATDDPIEVEISVEDRRIRVTVRDRGPGFDPARPREGSEEGGWGLVLITLLSSRWDVERRDTGTDVWFEFDREAGATGT